VGGGTTTPSHERTRQLSPRRSQFECPRSESVIGCSRVHPRAGPSLYRGTSDRGELVRTESSAGVGEHLLPGTISLRHRGQLFFVNSPRCITRVTVRSWRVRRTNSYTVKLYFAIYNPSFGASRRMSCERSVDRFTLGFALTVHGPLFGALDERYRWLLPSGLTLPRPSYDPRPESRPNLCAGATQGILAEVAQQPKLPIATILDCVSILPDEPTSSTYSRCFMPDGTESPPDSA